MALVPKFVPGQKREGGGQAAMSPAMRPWSHAPPPLPRQNWVYEQNIVQTYYNYAIEIILFVKPNSEGEKHWLNLSLRAGVVKNQDTLGGPSIWPSKFHVWCPYITNDTSWKLLCSSFANIIYKVAKIEFFSKIQLFSKNVQKMIKFCFLQEKVVMENPPTHIPKNALNYSQIQLMLPRNVSIRYRVSTK